ncbi:hypothetical protein J6590_037435, partial [Homalodisca vitripennis]
LQSLVNTCTICLGRRTCGDSCVFNSPHILVPPHTHRLLAEAAILPPDVFIKDVAGLQSWVNTCMLCLGRWTCGDSCVFNSPHILVPPHTHRLLDEAAILPPDVFIVFCLTKIRSCCFLHSRSEHLLQ